MNIPCSHPLRSNFHCCLGQFCLAQYLARSPSPHLGRYQWMFRLQTHSVGWFRWWHLSAFQLMAASHFDVPLPRQIQSALAGAGSMPFCFFSSKTLAERAKFTEHKYRWRLEELAQCKTLAQPHFSWSVPIFGSELSWGRCLTLFKMKRPRRCTESSVMIVLLVDSHTRRWQRAPRDLTRACARRACRVVQQSASGILLVVVSHASRAFVKMMDLHVHIAHDYVFYSMDSCIAEVEPLSLYKIVSCMTHGMFHVTVMDWFEFRGSKNRKDSLRMHVYYHLHPWTLVDKSTRTNTQRPTPWSMGQSIMINQSSHFQPCISDENYRKPWNDVHVHASRTHKATFIFQPNCCEYMKHKMIAT